MTTETNAPVARGPLIEWHRQGGATIAIRDGWELATRYPQPVAPGGLALVERAHRATVEINGPEVEARLAELCGGALAVRQIHVAAGFEVYRATRTRALVFGRCPAVAGALDVTGGWSSIALVGPRAVDLLSKVTAVDLREATLPVAGCCQGPIFGVNTLFGRFADRFELHVCPDSAEFLCDVLMDAGQEFGLAPAGADDLALGENR